MKTAINYKFIHVRFQDRQVYDFFNFQLQERDNQLVLYYESKVNGAVFMHYKNLYPWKINYVDCLSDRPNNFSIPGGKLEKFDINNEVLSHSCIL